MPKDFEVQNNFARYIQNVRAEVHPDAAIQSTALNAINEMSHHFVEKVLTRADMLLRGKPTLDARTVQAAIRMVLPGELGTHAVSELTKAVVKYTSSNRGTQANPVSKVRRAGLQVPPALVERIMRSKLAGCSRVAETAPVALAAATEYIMAEILELAGNAARDNRKTRISEVHVFLAIENDEELRMLFDGVQNGGVMPHIHSMLLPKRNNY